MEIINTPMYKDLNGELHQNKEDCIHEDRKVHIWNDLEMSLYDGMMRDEIVEMIAYNLDIIKDID